MGAMALRSVPSLMLSKMFALMTGPSSINLSIAGNKPITHRKDGMIKIKLISKKDKSERN